MTDIEKAKVLAIAEMMKKAEIDLQKGTLSCSEFSTEEIMHLGLQCLAAAKRLMYHMEAMNIDPNTKADDDKMTEIISKLARYKMSIKAGKEVIGTVSLPKSEIQRIVTDLKMNGFGNIVKWDSYATDLEEDNDKLHNENEDLRAEIERQRDLIKDLRYKIELLEGNRK